MRVRSDVKHQDVSGWVLLSKVAWIFDEIERRVGQSAGSEGIGITSEAFRSMLYRKQRRVQARNVKAAILFLRSLREAEVHHDRRSRMGRPSGTYRVQGIVYAHVNRTTREVKNVKLNQAQVVAMYGICTELGFGSHLGFEVMSQEETSGDILIDVTGDYLSGPGRYKLFARGGRQFISGVAKPDLSDPAEALTALE